MYQLCNSLGQINSTMQHVKNLVTRLHTRRDALEVHAIIREALETMFIQILDTTLARAVSVDVCQIKRLIISVVHLE
jgi:hypothetical protein